jgi:TetR/AcrR family transcriptional regulator, copper-responsive repressor
LDREPALETALRLFWRQGYEGTSIADLTEAMGVTPPSLYAEFGSKAQLYKEALDRYSASHRSFTRRALNEEPTARAAIERILNDAIELYCGQGDNPKGCMLASGAVACAPEHADVAADLSRRRQSAINLLAARLDRAAAEGEIPPGTDTASLAHYFASVIQGVSIQARDGADKGTLRSIAALALKAWPSS